MLDTVARPLFAFVRIHRVKSLEYLRGQEQHARREVAMAELRPGATPGARIHWSRFGSEQGQYVADFKRMKEATGARERGGAALAVHALIGVSAEWFQETGDLHDPANHRLEDAFREARVWAEQHLGNVVAARMDLDERGGGVIDVYAMPVHVRQARPKKDGTRGPGVVEISVKSALTAMQKAAGGGKSFAAAQTLWARHAHDKLDARIVRGAPRSITGREHLTVQQYRESIERHDEYERRREGSLQTMDTSITVWLEAEAAQNARADALAAEEAALRRHQRDVANRVTWLAADEASLGAEATRIAEQADDVARARAAFAAERSTQNARLDAREDALARAEEEHRAVMATREAHFAHREAMLAAVDRSAREREVEARTTSEEADRRLSAARSAAQRLQQDEAALAGEARLLETERAILADRIRRERDEADRRQRTLDEQRRRLIGEAAEAEAQRDALALGVRSIEVGELRSEHDIEARLDLRPAFTVLASLARSVEHRVAAIVSPVTEALARREAGLITGEQELHRREEDAARRERNFDHWQRAMRVGLERIGSGAVRTEADLDGLPAAQPARAFLGQIVAVVASVVDRETRGLAAARQQALDQEGRAREVLAKARVDAEGAARAKLAAESEQKEAKALRADAIARARAANALLRQARLLVETCGPLMNTLPATVANAVRALAAARDGWATFKGADRER